MFTLDPQHQFLLVVELCLTLLSLLQSGVTGVVMPASVLVRTYRPKLFESCVVVARTQRRADPDKYRNVWAKYVHTFRFATRFHD